MILTDAFIETYTPIFQAMAAKFTSDHALREDLVQVAFTELLSVDAGRIRRNPDSFLRMVAKHTMLSELHSYTKGEWYTGRGGKKSRYVSISTLLKNERLQVSDAGQLLPGERAEEENSYFIEDHDQYEHFGGGYARG